MATNTTKTNDAKKEIKKVPVNIPLTPDKTDDVYVSVMGVGEYQIKRGVTVMVPEPIAEVINRSIEMDTNNLRKRIEMEQDLIANHKAELGL